MRYSNKADAERVMAHFNGMRVCGTTVKASPAHEKCPKNRNKVTESESGDSRLKPGSRESGVIKFKPQNSIEWDSIPPLVTATRQSRDRSCDRHVANRGQSCDRPAANGCQSHDRSRDRPMANQFMSRNTPVANRCQSRDRSCDRPMASQFHPCGTPVANKCQSHDHSRVSHDQRRGSCDGAELDRRVEQRFRSLLSELALSDEEDDDDNDSLLGFEWDSSLLEDPLPALTRVSGSDTSGNPDSTPSSSTCSLTTPPDSSHSSSHTLSPASSSVSSASQEVPLIAMTMPLPPLSALPGEEGGLLPVTVARVTCEGVWLGRVELFMITL